MNFTCLLRHILHEMGLFYMYNVFSQLSDHSYCVVSSRQFLHAFQLAAATFINKFHWSANETQ